MIEETTTDPLYPNTMAAVTPVPVVTGVHQGVTVPHLTITTADTRTQRNLHAVALGITEAATSGAGQVYLKMAAPKAGDRGAAYCRTAPCAM